MFAPRDRIYVSARPADLSPAHSSHPDADERPRSTPERRETRAEPPIVEQKSTSNPRARVRKFGRGGNGGRVVPADGGGAEAAVRPEGHQDRASRREFPSPARPPTRSFRRTRRKGAPPAQPSFKARNDPSVPSPDCPIARLDRPADHRCPKLDSPRQGCSASPHSDDNLFVWSATIFGPDETAWEGEWSVQSTKINCPHPGRLSSCLDVTTELTAKN